MSFDDFKAKPGRWPATVLDLDLDTCTLTYSNSPCQAALGVTGDIKCFNTQGTCQDTANYTRGTKTYRFVDQGEVPPELDAFPCIIGVDYASTEIRPGEGLGVRASVKVRLKDFPHGDRGIDPYIDSRSYDPFERGTFFGKLRARNIHYPGRIMKLREGYMDSPFSLDNFKSRVYVIEQFKGPDADGVVEIVGKDILKLADDKRAKVPAPSKGQLASGVDEGSTSLTFRDGEGAGYDGAGYVRIGDEIIQLGSRSGDTWSGCTRGRWGSAKQSHDADEAVQACKVWSGTGVNSIIGDILANFAGVSAAYIPSTDWAAEVNTYMQGFDLTTVISEPMGCRELLDELTVHIMADLFWDEVDQEIKLRSQTPWKDTTTTLTDGENIIAGTIKVTDELDKRVTRAVTHFRPRDYTETDEEPEDFRWRLQQTDEDEESADQFGSVRYRTIYSRWFRKEHREIVKMLNSRILGRFGGTPRRVRFRMDAKDSGNKVGDVVDIQTRLIQEDTGADGTIRAQITKMKPVMAGHEYEYEAFSYQEQPALSLTVNSPTDNINLHTELSGPVDVSSVELVNASGNVIWSDTTSQAAIYSGPFASGSHITFINCGDVRGMGGAGGGGGRARTLYTTATGWSGTAFDGFDGGDAGPAMELASGVNMTVQNSFGTIFGGGGGGAGGDGAFVNGGAWSGGGGGGGRSYVPTAGGAAGLVISTSSATATVYADADGNTSITAPFSSGPGGDFTIHASPGRYDIIESGPEINTIFLRDIRIGADPAADVTGVNTALNTVNVNSHTAVQVDDQASTGGQNLLDGNARTQVSAPTTTRVQLPDRSIR